MSSRRSPLNPPRAHLRSRMRAALSLPLTGLLLAAAAETSQSQISDGNGAYATGHYRNLFVARDFVEALWKTPVPSGEQRYYDGMLYMMNMMHLGGEFRIWSPK